MSNLPRCSMTGIPIHDSGDGIYDDGEWISWEWINSYLDGEEDSRGPHELSPEERAMELDDVLWDFVALARDYHTLTGRYLEIWGELGELYAEIHHGLVRHPKHFAGSDGTIDGALVEVKTISPEKKTKHVHVKRAGNFEKLLVVRIAEDWCFSSRLFDRAELKEGAGTLIRARCDEVD